MAFYEAPSTSAQPDEHTFLCGYNRVRKYGTTKSLQDSTPQHYFIYTVQSTDTLEGIALRNNCSVSEIVRMNKLWSAQALHLKETIKIPLKGEGDSPATSQSPRPRTVTPPVESAESLNEMLSRIDKSIKSTSKAAKSIERHSSLHHLDDQNGSPLHNSLHDKVFVSKSRITQAELPLEDGHLPLLLLLLVFVHDGATKQYKFEAKIELDDKCNNGFNSHADQFKPLILKGVKLILFGKVDGKYGQVVLGLAHESNNIALTGTLTVGGLMYEVNDKNMIKSLDAMSQKDTQIYLYVDDPEQKSALYFGAPDDLYTRTDYADEKENPYFGTPVRLKSVTVIVNGKVIHKLERNHEDCDETTVDWITKAGIYRGVKCEEKYGNCKGIAWLTTYYDPAVGYVEV